MDDDMLRVEEERGKGEERRRISTVKKECRMGRGKDMNEKREQKRRKRIS